MWLEGSGGIPDRHDGRLRPPPGGRQQGSKHWPGYGLGGAAQILGASLHRHTASPGGAYRKKKTLTKLEKCHTFHSSSEHNTMKLHCIICIIFSFASVFLVQYEPNQKQNVNFCVTCLKGQEVVLKWCVNWFFTQQHHNEQSIVWEYTQTHNILQMARSTT